MKNIFLILAFIVSSTIQSQTLTEVYSKYIQPTNSIEDLQEGLKQVNNICEVTPQEKCNKAKASAYYLMADSYYAKAWSTYKTDTTLVQPILLKANDLFNKANKLMAITEFSESQKNMMLNDKNYFESLVNK